MGVFGDLLDNFGIHFFIIVFFGNLLDNFDMHFFIIKFFGNLLDDFDMHFFIIEFFGNLLDILDMQFFTLWGLSVIYRVPVLVLGEESFVMTFSLFSFFFLNIFYQELLKEKSNPRLKGNRKGIIVKGKEFYIPILNTFPTR